MTLTRQYFRFRKVEFCSNDTFLGDCDQRVHLRFPGGVSKIYMLLFRGSFQKNRRRANDCFVGRVGVGLQHRNVESGIKISYFRYVGVATRPGLPGLHSV